MLTDEQAAHARMIVVDVLRELAKGLEDRVAHLRKVEREVEARALDHLMSEIWWLKSTKESGNE